MIQTQSKYFERPPPSRIADRFVCLWTQFIEGERGGIHRHKVLPDGCIDIVWVQGELPVVAGPATGCLNVGLPIGAAVVGARFQPGCASGFLGIPAAELRDQEVSLRDVWKDRADRLTESLFRQNSIDGWLCVLSDTLLRRAPDADNPDRAIQAAARWLARDPRIRVRDLAGALGVSDRHLQRRFADEVGYGPKTFQRIVRLQRLLKLADRETSLAQLAGDVGYADQAHMNREVRALADTSPKNLVRRPGSTLDMSDLFNTAADETSSVAS